MTDIEHETKAAADAVNDAFTPVVEAFKAAQDKIHVPDAARDFVKRSAEMAKDRAGKIHTGTGQLTSRLESAATDAVSGAAALSRNVQQAAYSDAEAFFTAIEKVASATSVKEAVQIQIDFLRARNETVVARTKAMTEYFTKAFTDGVQAAQENMAKAASFTKAA